jgi:uncharacterized tellurite resistance protein B-like protein
MKDKKIATQLLNESYKCKQKHLKELLEKIETQLQDTTLSHKDKKTLQRAKTITTTKLLH